MDFLSPLFDLGVQNHHTPAWWKDWPLLCHFSLPRGLCKPEELAISGLEWLIRGPHVGREGITWQRVDKECPTLPCHLHASGPPFSPSRSTTVWTWPTAHLCPDANKTYKKTRFWALQQVRGDNIWMAWHQFPQETCHWVMWPEGPHCSEHALCRHSGSHLPYESFQRHVFTCNMNLHFKWIHMVMVITFRNVYLSWLHVPNAMSNLC